MIVRIQPRPNMAVVKKLLTMADLPTEDLVEDQMAHFFVATVEDEVIGVVGAVPCGPDVLLRSLMVVDALRGHGAGARLVTAAETHALDLGASYLYLLTVTAEAFFRGRSYRVIPRETAPESIRRTREYTHLCPASAVLMCKQLRNPQGG